MSTKMTLRIKSSSSEETENLGSLLGHQLKGGEVIELISDLGGGKTTFTRGLVRGAGSDDSVASPTFTISRVYKTPSFNIHHFDFYRLEDAGLAAYELQDLLDDPTVVVIVEWAGVVDHVLPADRLTITITPLAETTRLLSCSFSEDLKYAMEGLC